MLAPVVTEDVELVDEVVLDDDVLDELAACHGGVGALGVEPDPDEAPVSAAVNPACCWDQARSRLGSIETIPMTRFRPRTRARAQSAPRGFPRG